MGQSTNSIVEDTTKVYNEIRQLFRFDIPLFLVFSSDFQTVKEVLSDPTLKAWSYCYFKGEKISSEELKMKLDLASSDRSFASIAEEAPEELRHEKALKFRDNMYRDARWVKIEDLYGLNNSRYVELGMTSLTQSDIKAFINYWMNSDIDLFRSMRIKTTENFETDDVLYGLPALHIDNSTTSFIKAKLSGTRKRPLLCVTKANSLFLTAWAPEEFTCQGGEECDNLIRTKHGVIDLLIEKTQLESEEESADSENKRRIRSRLNQSSNSTVENTTRVYNGMKSIFRFKEPISLIFSADYKKVTTVKEVLSDSTLQDWIYCHFKSETIDLEELKTILDMATPNRDFICDATNVPENFKHENALKFRVNEYEDARWVRIEDLYGLHNIAGVELRKTSFTQSDMKAFVNHWVNSDIDMFKFVDITTEEILDKNEIIDGLDILHLENRIMCFAMAKTLNKREYPLLSFLIDGNRLTLVAENLHIRSDEELDEFTLVKEKQGVFALLMEKKQREAELLESADKNDRQRISKRMKQVYDEIEDYGVYFDNGKATLRMTIQ
ncbi:hypothetical protein CAEBREN_00061 [Caenorhabditis brenneri]|uniref:Uncharacterized protein n=1 Tax=Caenorhabditis brenneri TaxID=135651 RepID=G0NZP4_CAEBE|nr:hypothetical protein CAEBREN_00061 [Caenorhabditis brenneri]